MYLHIEKEKVILKKDLIGIFSVNSLKNSKLNKKLLEEIEDIKNDVLILTNVNKKDKYSFSDVSINTIQKRLNK